MGRVLFRRPPPEPCGRAGETHREQSRQGAPVRPNNLVEAVEKTVVQHRALLHEPEEIGPVHSGMPLETTARSRWVTRL